MRIIKRSTLVDFWRRHPLSEQDLRTWCSIAKASSWSSPQHVKNMFPKASIISDERVVFNICGGNYRLIVAIKYSAGIVFIKFIGTHSEYDRVDAKTVARY